MASNFALNQLLPEISANHDVYLWLSGKVGNNSALPKQLETLKFFEQDLFNHLLAPLMLSTKGNIAFKGFDGLNCFLCDELKEVNRINSPESVATLNALSPDLIISIRFGGILKEDVINIPTHGVINLHSGILPQYKGVMATFWALKNNEPMIGTTLHAIEDGTIDTGKVIIISTMSVERDKSYLWHVLALYKQGTKDILDAINILNEGKKLGFTPQAQSDSYFTFPSAIECKDFEDKGWQFVNEQGYLKFMQAHYL